MSLFDDHVTRALGAASGDSQRMLPVIEKEILHHDIIRTLQERGFLSKLVFFGGTNLRLCYDASRYSEDLDFKGGPQFTESVLGDMATDLEKAIARKYGLESRITQPKQVVGNTRTWSILVVTRPGASSERQQKIHIDVCTLSCHESSPRRLSNHYAVDLGTAGLIIRSQSLRESYTDKLLAIAFRQRILPRDVWDVAWLRQNPANAAPVALRAKCAEHRRDLDSFAAACARRADIVVTAGFHKTFLGELERFLPTRLLPTIRDPAFLQSIAQTVREDSERFVYQATQGRESPWEL